MSRVILFLYRVAMRLKRWRIPVLPILIQYAIRCAFGCHITLGARIGRHTHLAYGGLGTVIHSAAVIGENVYIGTNVTIGGRNGTIYVPTIGDNCFIGTGAKLLGHITVGRDCVIGANSVVLIDVPERSCVAGVPGKIVKREIDISQYRTRADMRFYAAKDRVNRPVSRSPVVANSMALTNVPERAHDAGVPAKTVKQEIDIAEYREREDTRFPVVKNQVDGPDSHTLPHE